ncbi:dTDP-4-dehydrorhamnose 3,5-epimerase [Brevundimonas subvibrioides]|uniref:dTDP-4-dehydrorhamnose 3,5-epimerase n=1 Tax=Brevundimonas subvibrioides (strain ATCC 15264 / DSM 4735 / LMG 14903 / NBRC 16000 / CB 81) TaxID=633149 RepID=D9QEY7_BRESC|nr:dTDP-4-dehydrorhamnose 3,5-epimerase [Brevundimonas subvibrioides]ADL00472.1 dTDP-4-dehydrorhamnose 3,5-epimerase [Brevundimonas subvibrioides ATCC 15264]
MAFIPESMSQRSGLQQPSSPFLYESRRFGDDRGWFTETYSERALADRGVSDRFVQDNQSLSIAPGTVRGIHFQRPPFAQAKLVRCLRGRIMDYAVDLRRGSPTYGDWVSAELTADNGLQLYVPVGYGHAFVTLEPRTEVVYKVNAVYAADCDGGIVWDDPDIGIEWSLPPSGPLLSEKDRQLPRLADFDSPFDYDGRPLEPLPPL